MMDGQRVRTCWISKKDRLPRQLFGERIVAKPQTTEEVWENMELNPALLWLVRRRQRGQITAAKP